MVPVSMVVDWLVNHNLLPWQGIVGVVMIVIGFFALIISEAFEEFYLNRHASPARQPEKNSINTVPVKKRWWQKGNLLHYVI